MKNPIIQTIIAIFLTLLVLAATGIVATSFSQITELDILNNSVTHLTMLVVSILLILAFNKGRLKGYGFRLTKNFPIVKIILISLIFGSISSFLIILSDSASNEFLPTKDFSFLDQIICVWLLASIAEEVLFRGLIQGFLSRFENIGIKIYSCFISLPVIVAAILFGAMHLALFGMGVDSFTVLDIVFFGIILGLIAGYYREKTNSLIPAFIVHFCFNIGGSIFEIIKLF
ncbi:MAG: CPBP family intramembrane metalloprotease [Candidatus Delongbacteria bacterium]|nr:CPBP family intramembrane metalloprotease [Candidatus Delongbacteria bacterium]